MDHILHHFARITSLTFLGQELQSFHEDLLGMEARTKTVGDTVENQVFAQTTCPIKPKVSTHTSKSFNFTYATISYVYICFSTYWLASPKPNYTKYHNINRTVNLYSHSNMEKNWAFRTAPWTSPHLVPAFANTSALARSRILAGKMSWQVQTSISNFMENYHNLSGRSAKPQLKNAM